MTPDRRAPLIDRIPQPLRALLQAIGWHRRLIAASLVALSVAASLSAFAPEPPRVVRVLAAARDLPGGVTLAAGDVRTIGMPPGVVPTGAVQAGTDVVGRVLAGPLRRGEAMTDVRLVGSALYDALGDDGLVAAPIRIADAGVARLLRSGDRVDVIAASTKDAGAVSSAPVVASDVSVIAVPDPDATASGLDDGALVVLATTPSTAAALARAAVGARLTVTIRGA